LSKQQLEKISPETDLVGQRLSCQTIKDAPALVKIGPLVQGLASRISSSKDRDQKKKHLDYVPSRLEIKVLRTLWEEKEAPGETIYARLDTSWHITAEDLNSVLEHLTEIGFVSRKKISPQNTFTIATPLGSYGIEMSELNRKNSVYLYKPIIQRDDLLRFFNALLFLAQSNPAAVDPHQEDVQKDLIERWLELVQK
ncbi:MAG: hypothetical protein ONB05_08845, partial [candidate division KSB1 bacterium]|nr:hypothetical protein [candidate division KSB1 bacterium]